MFGSTQLYTALNTAAITAKVDTFKSAAAIFSDMLIPQDFTGNKSINFYMASRTQDSEVEIYTYTINCRALTYNLSRDIANAVINAISRKNYSDCFIYITPQATLSPLDDRDTYNTTLEAVVKLS